METTRYELDNGLRLIHMHTPHAQVAHCGFIINAGTRDESKNESGIAHFIEHTLFKGTKKRKAYHILSRLDAVGGELNAYTTKEDTCIYASFLTTHYARAIELTADITFNATFPSKEVKKEKEVIIEEINAYLDAADEQILDEFEERIFNGHELGQNILGTESSIKSHSTRDLIGFYKRNYVTEQIVFSFVGNIPFNKVLKCLEKATINLKRGNRINKRKKFKTYNQFNVQQKKQCIQAHYTLGNIAYDMNHAQRMRLILLNNLLGGPAMNSRLNLQVREKHGYTYCIESSYNPFCDSGIFMIYLSTETKWLDKSISLINKELKKLRETALGTGQLHAAKQQLIGQISLSQESGVTSMLAMGKSLLEYDKVEEIEKVFKDIINITSSELLEIANETFDEKQLSSLTYLPK